MRRAALLAVVAAALAPGAARAQCGTDPLSHFNKVAAAPAALVFPPATFAEFQAGYVGVRTYVVEVHPISRDRLRPWFLCMSADAAQFPSNTGTLKPASDAEWSVDGVTWAPLTASPLPVGPTYVGRQEVTVRFRVRLRYSDAPGTYGPLPMRFWAGH